jgi:hypothetical protein
MNHISKITKRTFIVSAKSFLVLLSISASLVSTGCEEEQADVGDLKSSCLDFASRLDMDSEGEITISETEKVVEIRRGDLTCLYTRSGELKRIENETLEERPAAGEALVTDAATALGIASRALQEIDFEMEPSAVLSPEPPWDESKVLVSVVSEPTAYGYPTHGFAGRLEVRVNRYSGKVAAIVRLIGGVCDPPNIQVTEADAKRLAEQEWARSSQKKDGVEYQMVLQYYVPSEDEATPKGAFYRDHDRVRLCWVAAYYIPLRLNGESHVKPIGDVVIDSETGELLSVPD